MILGWISISHFPKQAMAFTCLQYKSFQNTNNFFFSHSVYQFGELTAIFIKIIIVVGKLFQFGKV